MVTSREDDGPARGTNAPERWTSLVAHELRQPLAAILVGVGRLAAVADPEVQATTHRLRGAARRLDRLVGDLVDEAAIRRGALALRVQPSHLGAVALATLLGADHLARSTPLELVTPCVVPPVAADPDRIGQVLTNLIDNAVKYGDDGAPVRVTVSTRGSEVVTSVANRGPAIPEDERDRIFRAGYRTAEAQGGPARGLGLGLYIAWSLVAAHGGHMGVDRADGETIFWFALPCGPARPDPGDGAA